ncbi:MAG: hypothetical protein RLZZ241_1701 [Bacteroidota bacterium]|jgi:hypothetical protein
MGITQHIEALLYRYQCVVVPSFGAFLTQNKPAFLQKDSNTFFPPSRVVSFNAQLQANDGLLVSHISQAEKMPYDEALKRVELVALEWMELVRKNGLLRLEGIGEFRLNSEGKISFKSTDSNNYLPSSFGLSSVMSTPVIRETLKAEVSRLEDQAPFTITPEARKIPGLRPFVKYAAIVLLAITTGLSGYTWYNSQRKALAQAQVNAAELVTKRIQEATFFSSQPLELPSVVLEISRETPEVFTHHIIAGAFRIKENADRKIAQLRNQGFEATYVGENSWGLHQVAFGSYSNESEAKEALASIKRTQKDAWLLSDH